MKIEILTQETSNKPEILTFLANEPGVRARGDELELPDLKLEIGDNYLLFTIRDWQRAEQIIPRLFLIRPNAYSPNYFEPYTDQKILITARSKELLEIIPELSAIEHLNLEQGELAGSFQFRWQARDVAVLAKAELMVEGEVAFCRVKFETINRETEYQCRDLIAAVKLSEIIKVFSSELLEVPAAPAITGPVIEAEGTVDPEHWSDFINTSQAKIDFDSTSNEIKLVFSGQNYISFKDQGSKRNFMLNFTDPDLLTPEFLGSLEKLDLGSLKMFVKMENAALEINQLVKSLNFKKDRDFFNFSYSDAFKATYNVKTRCLYLETDISLNDPVLPETIKNIHGKMQDFLNRVCDLVV